MAALTEVQINKFSQLVYLESHPKALGNKLPTVGELADYYLEDATGRVYLKARFGDIQREYDGWLAFLREGVGDIRDFRVCNLMSDNKPDQSGFYGCGYRSPEGELVAAFRGSEMLGNNRYKNDYHNDLALSYSPKTPQQAKVEDYLSRFEDYSTTPFWVTGHSLGGNLAMYGAICAPQQVQKMLRGCYSFNGPGFNNSFLEKNGPLLRAVEPKLWVFQNTHDIVSSLLHSPGDPILVASRYDPGEGEGEISMADLLYPHSNFMIQVDGSGNSFARSDTPKDPLCQLIGVFSQQFLRLPALMREGVCKIILEALYNDTPEEKQLRFLTEQVSRYLVNNGLPDQDEAGLRLSTTAYQTKYRVEHPLQNGELYRRILKGDGEFSLPDAVFLLIRLLRYLLAGKRGK